MVVAMATWAREQALTDVDLTVLAIEPPSWDANRWRESRDPTLTSGLVFSIIHLGEVEAALFELGPPVQTPRDLGSDVWSSRTPPRRGFSGPGCNSRPSWSVGTDAF